MYTYPDVLVVATEALTSLLRAMLAEVAPDSAVLCAGSTTEAAQALAVSRLQVAVFEPALLPDDPFAGLRQLVVAAPDCAFVVVGSNLDCAAWERAGAQVCLPSAGLRADVLWRALLQAQQGVTDRRQTGSREQDLAAAFDLSPAAMWIQEPVSLAFVEVNNAACLTFAHSREQLLAMRLSDLYGANEAGGDWPVQSGSVIRRLRSVPGTEAVMELLVRHIEFSGRPAHLVVARDVSALHRSTDEIEASELRLRALFEHSLGLVCIHDLDGTLRTLNPAAAHALGYAVETLLGRSMLQIIPPSLHAHFRHYLKRIASAGQDAGLLYLLHQDGSTRVWEYNNRLYTDPPGAPVVMGNAVDVTQRREQEQRLRLQQAELEAVNDSSPLGLFRADPNGEWTYVNRSFERIAALRSDQALGRGWLRALHPDDRGQVEVGWGAAVASCEPYLSTHRIQHEDSPSNLWVSMEATPLVIEGEVNGYVGSLEDITARHLAELRLRRNESRLRTITDSLPAQIAYIDANSRFEFVNNAYEKAYRRDRSSIVGCTLREVLDATTYQRRKPYLDQAWRGQRVTFEDEQDIDGDYRCLEISYVPQWNEEQDKVIGLLGMSQDITRKKLQERQWLQAAEIDSLTGLANRAGFITRLERAIVRSRDQRSMLAIMFLDIDHFKQINDTHGHAVGDAVLGLFAERLSAVLRVSDVIGRLGGDEFTVFTENVRRQEYAAAVAAKVVSAMRRPFVLSESGLTLSITTSVGLALSKNELDTTSASLLERADAALYAAKAAGRNAYRIAGVPGRSVDDAETPT